MPPKAPSVITIVPKTGGRGKAFRAEELESAFYEKDATKSSF